MRSMTGYGRGEATANGWKLEIELSGVNRKQVDISVNLPSALFELESEARNLLAKSISRGRLAAKVLLTHEEGTDNRLLFDEGLAKQYVAAVRRIAAEHGGRIEVESTPGHGSRFRLSLPLRRSLTAAA